MTDIDTPTDVVDATIELDRLLERYIAVWNNPDPAARRAEIEALWAEDAYFANALYEYRGHDEIAVGVGRSHDKWVGTGHVFRSAGTTASHHGVAKFVWNMFGPDGDEPVAVGTNFIRVADGRIVFDYQFVHP
jgi:hypothetical protein